MEKMDINKHIGKVCQEYRLKNNLTQNQVAELTGLEPRHISQIERGLSKGSIDTLLKLCNAYEITPDIILSFTEFVIANIVDNIKTANIIEVGIIIFFKYFLNVLFLLDCCLFLLLLLLIFSPFYLTTR